MKRYRTDNISDLSPRKRKIFHNLRNEKNKSNREVHRLKHCVQDLHQLQQCIDEMNKMSESTLQDLLENSNIEPVQQALVKEILACSKQKKFEREKVLR